MLPNPMQILQMLINKNPNIANNPTIKEALTAIQNNDNEKGAAIANNLCNTYGVDKTKALEQVKTMFGGHN